MSLLLRSTRSHALLPLEPPKQDGQPKSVKPASSFANLLYAAKSQIETFGAVAEEWYDGSTEEEKIKKQALEDKKQLLYLKLRTATTRDAWDAAAIDLDEIEGNNKWKSTFESTDYDTTLIQASLRQMDEARISCDIGKMLFLVRTSLTRNLGDMGNLAMYKHSHVGTKDLIERYIISVTSTLDALLDVSAKARCDAMESRYILEQLLSTRQAFGRSALLLSGGATFGMNHIGVLKALIDAQLLPRIISGASAGSIVAAVVCTRTDAEIPHLLETFCSGSLDVFDEDGTDGMIRKITRFLKHGALYDIENLTKIMRELLGDMTFQEAYNRTRKILNITVSSASLYELPRLLNYITAPNVLIWSAVAASCSVPFVYTPASLLAKDANTGEAVPWNPLPQQWIDGSVDNDIPMTRLAEMFNVNHFIVSQVNPHVVPFLKEEGLLHTQPLTGPSSSSTDPTWLESFSLLAKGEAIHRMHTLADFGIFPNLLTKTISVLSQKYSGDITILPEISYADFPRMLSNPTVDFMQAAMLSGERATWPKISIIKNHCAIELALDDTVQKLRTRVVFEPDEVAHRHTHVKRNSITGSHRTVRKRASKTRPLSQASAQEPLQGRPLSRQSAKDRKFDATPVKVGTVGSKPHAIERQKRPGSINTVLGPRASRSSSALHHPPIPLPKTADFLGAPPRSSNDITSSGHEDETSNLTSRSSSSTSLDFSASEFSDSKPMRSLSQPNTPLAMPSTPTGTMLGGPAGRSGQLAMTPAVSAHVPGEGSKYKRMFSSAGGKKDRGGLLGRQKKSSSGGKGKGVDGGASAGSGSEGGGGKKGWGLEIGLGGRGKRRE